MIDNGTLSIQGFTPYAQIPRWILRAGDRLSHGSVRLYGVIMTYADNDTKSAFPGREKLAGDMGVKVRSVSAYIKELEDFGALVVTRRRNKRTGNFYSNHYVVVFAEPGAEYCTPRDAENDPITTPTITNYTQPSSTSDAGASDHEKSCTLERSSSASNPGGLSEDQRKTLRTSLQRVGEKLSNGHKWWSVPVQDEWHGFTMLIQEAFGDDYESCFADLLENDKWTVSAKVASPYQAGAELNKIINTGMAL